MGTFAAVVRRASVAAVSVSLVVSGLVATAPAAVASTGSALSGTQLSPPELNPKPVGRTTDLVAQVSPTGATGTVEFFDDESGSRTSLGSAPVVDNPYVFGLRIATITAPADMPTGTYHLVAVYSGDDTFASSESSLVDLTVGPRPTTAQLVVSSPYDGSGASAQQGDSLAVTVNVYDAGSYTPNQLPITGSVALTVDGGLVATIAPNSGTSISTSTWALGSHAIAATYDPGSSTDYSGSSTGAGISIVANTLDVSGVGVQYATFYPYKDGYRDTVAIRGSRQEAASVSIRVYSSTGRVVKSASVARATGPWSVAWNGRTSTGSLLAAGTYKVVQTVTDAHGLKKAFTAYVVLSLKRLYTYSATYTKNATTQVAKKTTTWVAWTFTLPSATVYKSLTFSIYGQDSFASGGFGPHDFTDCSSSYWSPSCATRWKSFPLRYAWASVTGSATRDRSGRYVRLYAWGGYGATRVQYGRVKVTYAILK